MVTPRSAAPLRYTASTTVVVVIIALLAMFAFLIPTAFAALGDQNNAIILTITTQNSAATHGLIQFHITTNTSLSTPVQFRIADLTNNCPITTSEYLFTPPQGGWDSVWYHATCTTKTGHIENYYAYYESGCALGFDFEHLDKDDEIVCFTQWNQAVSTSPAALVSLTLHPDYSSDARLTLAAPVELKPPMTWDVVPAPSYTFGNMTVKFVQGKDLLWVGAPKEMTKDKIVLSLQNAKLEPFSQYVLETLRLYKDGNTLFNVLRRMSSYQTINAYVAKDVRMWVHDGDYYILTGANPATTFDIEIVFSNFLAQHYANGAFTMASVEDDENEGQADHTTPRSHVHHRGGAKRQSRRHHRDAKHHTAEDFKAHFEQLQQQQQHLSTLSASPHKVLQNAAESPITIFARITRFEPSVLMVVQQQSSTSTESAVEATSAPIKQYTYYESSPDFLYITPLQLSPQGNTTVSVVASFHVVTKKENFTIDVAMDGYEGGFQNAQELMMYYGNAAQLVYSCGGGESPKPFNITAQSITGFCERAADVYVTPYIAAIVPTTKALKPFKIPITIDGRKNLFQLIPPHTTTYDQPFTKFTNTELAFNITTTFATQVELSYEGTPMVVEFDSSVMFTTPFLYQFGMDNPQHLLEDTLRCTAYNNNSNTNLSMTPHSGMGSPLRMFKDKKVDVKAKAGDAITITCTAPINPNPKSGSHSAWMYVKTIMADQYASLERDSDLTTPNEDWLEESDETITFTECVSVDHLMSPAPKTIEEAKQRTIELLKTAQWLEPRVDENAEPFVFVPTATAAINEQVDILAGLKNITTNDVFIEWFKSPMHEAPKTSALTAANGLDKVLEFNQKFSAGHVFAGEENRMFFWASVNTTAAPGFSRAVSQMRFTAANAEEGFSLLTMNSRLLYVDDNITTLNTSDIAKTMPQWGSDQGWACSTMAQCDGACVNGKCQSEDLPLIWSALDMYWVGDKFADFSDLGDQVKAADNNNNNNNNNTTPEQNNAAFAVGACGCYAVVMAVVAVVVMIF